MRPPDTVAAFLDDLSEALSFDRALARRVREEVEGYFHETIEAGVAEEEALARFGSVQDIAAEYAATSLTIRTKTAGLVFLLGVLSVYMTMRGRVAWWGPSDLSRVADVAAVFLPFMRAAFWSALLLGLLDWVVSVRIRFGRGTGARLRGLLPWAVLLGVGASLTSAACVASDALLVGMRLWGTPWDRALACPVLLLAAEAMLSAFLVHHWRVLAAHVSAGRRLLKPRPTSPSPAGKVLR